MLAKEVDERHAHLEQSSEKKLMYVILQSFIVIVFILSHLCYCTMYHCNYAINKPVSGYLPIVLFRFNQGPPWL